MDDFLKDALKVLAGGGAVGIGVFLLRAWSLRDKLSVGRERRAIEAWQKLFDEAIEERKQAIEDLRDERDQHQITKNEVARLRGVLNDHDIDYGVKT